MLSSLLLSLAIAAAPAKAAPAVSPIEGAHHFVFLFEGHPAGQVTLIRDSKAGTFTYRSEHWHRRGEHVGVTRRERTHKLKAIAPRQPEAMALLRPFKAPGAYEVVEDLEGTPTVLYIDEADPSFAGGQLSGQSFRAKYEDDLLQRIDLAQVSFVRVRGPLAPRAGKDAFGAGVPVTGRKGALRPSGEGKPPSIVGAEQLLPLKAEEAKRIVAEVHASFTNKVPSDADLGEDPLAADGSCLAHVRRALAGVEKAGGKAAVVHGFVAEAGTERAYPHVWIRVLTERGPLDFDPTLMIPVTQQTHLQLAMRLSTSADPSVGARYLEVFRGEGLKRGQ